MVLGRPARPNTAFAITAKDAKADIGAVTPPCDYSQMIDTDILFRNGDAAEEEGRLEFARQSFERGAALGDPSCLSRLARMYDEGIGLNVDKREAMRLYQLAWRRGHDAVAANNIAILYREAGKPRATFEWFGRAADTGDGSAQLYRAKCYLNGEGVRKDEQAALRCLAIAVTSFYISEHEREEAQALLENLRPKAV